jgi:SAM-dependent methyltransferase
MSETNDRTYEGVGNLEAMAEARNYNAFLAGLVVTRARGLKPVADFGAGTGLLAEMIAAAGINVVCIEPDPALRERLRARSLVAHGGLDAVAPESLRFAYSFNVLEHIEDDFAACQALYGRLAPGGRLLVYVPAFQVLFTAMDRKVGHVRRYTRASLTNQLGRAGFVIRQTEYVDSLGFFATLIFKWLGNQSGDIDKSAVKLYDRYLFPVSRVLDRVFCQLLGKNVLVVAERPAAGVSTSGAAEAN